MKLVLKIIVPPLIIVIAVVTFKIQKASAPERISKQPDNTTPSARYFEITPADHSPPVRTFGKVSSYFETTLTAQVSGRVIEVSPEFRIGRSVPKGTVLITIDPTDFNAEIVSRKANLSLAKRSLAEEEIRATQAAEDWQISGRDLSKAPDYVLRKPQLESAQNDVAAAQATVEKASADLDRTVIRAPFDALITARSVSPGNLANPQAQLGSLVATERVEVFLPLTPNQFRRITLPSANRPGPEVTFTSSLHPGATWTGRITRTAPTISRDQVVTVIAEIEKPFSKDPSLTIGAFVNAGLKANPLENTYRVPEAALVNDAYLWAIDTNNKLFRLMANRLHSDLGFAYLSLDPGILTQPLRIISRPLTNFEPGMEVKSIELTAK